MKKIIGFLTSLCLFGCSSTAYQTIDAKQAKEMMKDKDVVVIDVREEKEYFLGHIPGAILIPLGEIHAQNTNLPAKDQTLLIYCRSGRRSKQAAEKFVSLGYQDVYDFGGIIDWPYATTR